MEDNLEIMNKDCEDREMELLGYASNNSSFTLAEKDQAPSTGLYIPDDILTIIFSDYLIGQHRCINRLQQVCRRWYRLIRDSPLLWARIEILDRCLILEYLDQNYATLAYIEACIERSQGLPMDVEVDLGIVPEEFEYHPRGDQDYEEKRKRELHYYHHYLDRFSIALLGPGGCHALRWRTLHLHLRSGGYSSPEWLDFQAQNLVFFKLDNIENQLAYSEYTYYLDISTMKFVRTLILNALIPIERLGVSPHSLRHVDTGIDTEFYALQRLAPFKQLRSLCLRAPAASHHVDYFDKSSERYFSLPHLEELTLDGDYGSLSEISLDFPSLQILNLTTFSSFPPLPVVCPRRVYWSLGPQARESITQSQIDISIESLLLLYKDSETLTVNGVPQDMIKASVINFRNNRSAFNILDLQLRWRDDNGQTEDIIMEDECRHS